MGIEARKWLAEGNVLQTSTSIDSIQEEFEGNSDVYLEDLYTKGADEVSIDEEGCCSIIIIFPEDRTLWGDLFVSAADIIRWYADTSWVEELRQLTIDL